MAEYQCTCHCGGDMFYRHMHAESCPLSIYGDEVPGTEVDTLKRQVADLTRRLEEAQEKLTASGWVEIGLNYERDALQAKLAAVEQERDTMRTALLALPGGGQGTGASLRRAG